jgi:hypothetical protein
MDTSLVFQIVNTIVLPAWIILIFFPKKSWRNPVIYSFAVLMAILYTFYVITGLGDMDMESFSKLEGIKEMFSTDVAVLTGWIHYLVFDLLVGNWVLNNSQKHKINHYWVIPCLILCFMFGPIGYLIYSLVKLIQTKGLTRIMH